MKTKLLIIALLVSVSATAQVRNYKANQNELLNSFESGQISKEAYIDMTRFQMNRLTDSIQISIQKPHYNVCLDLAMIGGGVLYEKFGKNVSYDYILHSWGGYFATKGMCYTLDRLGCSKLVSAVAPFLFTSALCTLKEYMIDGTPSKSDLVAGIGGAALASISFTIDIDKLFKKIK